MIVKYAFWLIATAFLVPFATVAQPKKQPPTPVIVTVVESSSFADEVEALGTLKARESVDLTSSVTEAVTRVLFEDNQRVAKGDVLIEMDADEERAELDAQRALTKEAQRQVDRLVPLAKQGASSEAALEEAQSVLQAGQARMKGIDSRIEERVIRAPFDGVLGLRNISVGALVQPGLIITTIDDDSVMKLDFSVSELFLSSVVPGVTIEATSEAYPDKVFNGKIAHIDSRIDPITRSIQVRALLDNINGLLKPGLLMQVELRKNPREALLIPEEALLVSGTTSFVFVVTEGKAQRRVVQIGARQYGDVEVLDGLQAGEMIITQGISRVRDGSTVRIRATERAGDTLKTLLDRE